MRILVADDERDLNALIAQKLRKEHYSVDCCHDGEEALEYLRMADYDARRAGYHDAENRRHQRIERAACQWNLMCRCCC